MRRIALIAVALAACVASVPCMAAPPPYDCRVTAQSVELCSTVVAASATIDDASAIVVANTAMRQPVLAPVVYAQLNYVGRNPYRHIAIAGRRTIDYT